MPCVVWAEESKYSLGFESGPKYNDGPTTSQCATAWQWSMTNVTAGESPIRSEQKVMFWVIFRVFLLFIDSGRLCGWGATLWSGNTILRPKSLTQDHLMTQDGEWPIEQPSGPKSVPKVKLLREFLRFLPNWAASWGQVREPLCNRETTSWAVKTMTRIVWWK